jgi:hypothetical protein
MPGHSRPRDGVASLAYRRTSTTYFPTSGDKKDVDGRNKSGHGG